MERMDEQIVPALSRPLGCAFRAGPHALGLITFARALVQAVASPLGGLAGHFFDRVTVLFVGCAIWGFFCTAFSFATTVNQGMTAWAFNGVGLSLIIPNSQSLIADYYTATQRGEAFGTLMLTGAAGGMLGAIFATNLGGMTPMGMDGWRLAFMAVGAVSLAIGSFTFLLAVDPTRHNRAGPWGRRRSAGAGRHPHRSRGGGGKGAALPHVEGTTTAPAPGSGPPEGCPSLGAGPISPSASASAISASFPTAWDSAAADGDCSSGSETEPLLLSGSEWATADERQPAHGAGAGSRLPPPDPAWEPEDVAAPGPPCPSPSRPLLRRAKHQQHDLEGPGSSSAQGAGEIHAASDPWVGAGAAASGAAQAGHAKRVGGHGGCGRGFGPAEPEVSGCAVSGGGYESAAATAAAALGSRHAAAPLTWGRIWDMVTTPTFLIIILQGIVGSTPWNALVFLTLYLQLLGFSDGAASGLMALFLGGTAAGALVGGWLGDRVAERYPNHGRIVLVQFSVGIGVPISVLILRGLPLSATPATAVLYGTIMVMKGVLTSWAAPACNNPVFAEIVPPDLRNLVYAFDRSFEAEAPPPDLVKARALGDAMLLFMAVPWTLCALFYTGLHWTYPRDRARALTPQVEVYETGGAIPALPRKRVSHGGSASGGANGSGKV
ncbi:hypothetical protein GPECTOR_4g548 [Gonium pectorale]|uniref:Major facilitator superfamily (MFS) profile domain-containing protein n=1 Tax=Gonium pectorale TaxID=33097 RepID=A0A150GXK6_GONPE|nr:hypothetical protein GPECTOR_4g548 [Gonium pectorale]|eukprot:KXZ54483.1 hypothetical protein GPECTOR_4g548 [Gonium pectorale]